MSDFIQEWNISVLLRAEGLLYLRVKTMYAFEEYQYIE